MIEYIKGQLVELTPTQAIIETNGIGYTLNISLNTFSAIQGSENVKLYVYEAIREDSYTLFGFSDKQERNFFIALIAVSGVGGNTARMILSAFTPNELNEIISSGNDKLLKSVKGIGLKMAQRIIIDLKDKIILSDHSQTSSSPNATILSNDASNEAIAALTMLGFSMVPTQKAVAQILKEKQNLSVEQIIKLALKIL